MEKKDLSHQMSEIAILQALDSPYIAKILDVFEDAHSIKIVQEFIEGCNLFKFATTKYCPEKTSKQIMKGLASGL
jgi:serine/threonine protein kinase